MDRACTLYAFAAKEKMDWGSCCSCCPDRWTQVNQDLADQLQGAQSLLQLWKACSSAQAEAATRLEQQEAKYQQLANINMSGNNLAEILPPALCDIKVGVKPIEEKQDQEPDRQGHDPEDRQSTRREK